MAESTERKLRLPKVASRKVRKQVKHSQTKLPSVLTLCKLTLTTIKQNRRYFVRYVLLYVILSYVFIQTISTTANVLEAKQLIGESYGNSFMANLALYGGLIGSSAQLTNQVAAVYQFMIVLLFGLALVYGLRHMYDTESERVTLKQSLYKGMTPLVPVMLVLSVIAIQLLPLSIGTSIYATVVSSGLIASAIEQIGWILLTVALAGLSLYFVAGSILGLVIVTLPDMTPMRALRASRRLVRFRRLAILGKLLSLGVIIFILMGLVVIPAISMAPNIAQLVLFAASCCMLPIALTYVYNLYRSML